MSTLAAQPALKHDAEVIGLVGVAHGTSHFFHLMLPPMFPWLMKDFGLSFTQAGFLMTVFFVVSGIGQALAGFVVDRVGARPVLFFGLGTLSMSGLLAGLADGYPGLIVAAAVGGIGNSIFHPADFTLLNRRVSPLRLGHAFSVHGLSGSLGWVAAPFFITGLATIWNWHIAAFGAALVGLSVLSMLVLRRSALDDHQIETIVASSATLAHVAGTGASQAAFLRSAAVWNCFVFFFLSTSAFGILQNFATPVFEQMYAMPLALATAALTAYLGASAVGVVTGGFIAARYAESERVIAASLTLAALMALSLASGVVPSWAVLACMAVMGFGAGVTGPSRDLLVRKSATAQFGRSAFGRVYGFVYSGIDIGLAVSPLFIGPALDAGHFSAALYAVAALQVGALLSALVVGARVRQLAARPQG